jgi:hypothetical protein
MAAMFPDLSVTISQRRWACVLDPTLTLSRFGLLLVKRLGEVMELWVVRELWHVLDNTQYYLQQPASLLADRTPSAKVQEILCALQEWERVRGWKRISLDKGVIGLGMARSNPFFPMIRDRRSSGAMSE